MNETAEITCRMCDVVLRYAVSDAVPDDRGIRRVAVSYTHLTLPTN